MALRVGCMLDNVRWNVDITVHGVGIAEFCVSVWLDCMIKFFARAVKFRQKGVKFYFSGINKGVNGID